MRKIQLLMLCCLIGSMIQAQGWPWGIRAGGQGNNRAGAIVTDASGNHYITGVMRGEGTVSLHTTNLNGFGNNDFFISKLDATGNPLWTQVGGSPNNEGGYAIALDASGNIYVAGTMAHSDTAFIGGVTLDAANGKIFLQKYDNSGALQWTLQGATGSSVSVQDIKIHNNTIYMLAQSNFGETIGTYSISRGSFVATADMNGNWTNAMQVTYEGVVTNHLEIDASGNLFFAGTCNGGLRFGKWNGVVSQIELNLIGNEDCWMGKMSPSGDAVWARLWGGANDDYFYELEYDGGEYIYLAGMYTGQAVFEQDTLNFGAGSLLLVKADTTGNIIWTKTDDTGSQWDPAQSVKIASDGSLWVGGWRQSFAQNTIFIGSDSLPMPGSSTEQLWVAHADTAGNWLGAWNGGHNGGGQEENRLTDMSLSPADQPIFFGHYGGTAEFGSFTLNVQQWFTSEMFVAAFDPSMVASTDAIPDAEAISIWPNPCKNIMNIEWIDGGKLLVINSLGQQVIEADATMNQLNVSELPSGMYWLVIETDHKRMVKRFVVNK